MDDRRLAAIATAQCGVVSVGQLQACDLSTSGARHRVDRGRLFRVHRGVYALSPCRDVWQSMWAAVLAVDAHRAVVARWSAAVAHGFGTEVRGRHHVVVPTGHGASASGVVVHRTRTLAGQDVRIVRGLRVTSPARTILDIAISAPDDVVRRLIREAEFRGALRPGDLADAVVGRRGHPGVGRVRRVDPETAERALRQTPLEDEVDALLAATLLPEPVRQAPVRGASGRSRRVDFAWPAFRLVVEADGRAAHVRASAFHEDRRRDADLAAAGWLVLRFTRDQSLRAGHEVQQQVMGAATHRGWRIGGDTGPTPATR